jgi:hypothetical protein
LDLRLGPLPEGIFSGFGFLFAFKLFTLESDLPGLMPILRFSRQLFVGEVSSKLFFSLSESLGQRNDAGTDHIAASALDAVQ